MRVASGRRTGAINVRDTHVHATEPTGWRSGEDVVHDAEVKSVGAGKESPQDRRAHDQE